VVEMEEDSFSRINLQLDLNSLTTLSFEKLLEAQQHYLRLYSKVMEDAYNCFSEFKLNGTPESLKSYQLEKTKTRKSWLLFAID